jgi:hypothetical protein
VKILESVSLRIGFVHQRDFTCDSGPFEFTAKRLVASLTLKFFPLEKFVRESKVRLDYNIQAPGSDEAAKVGGQRRNQ